jgi:hypothetical protein
MIYPSGAAEGEGARELRQIGDVSRCQSDAAPAAVDWYVNQRQRCQSDAAPASRDWHYAELGFCQFSTAPTAWTGRPIFIALAAWPFREEISFIGM